MKGPVYIDSENVTRVEVILPGTGVLFQYFTDEVSVHVQDEGRTLKVFVGPKSGFAEAKFAENLRDIFVRMMREENQR